MNDEKDELDWAIYLANFREQNGFSQTQLADHVGISVYTIRRIENGEQPKLFEIRKMREYFEKLPAADWSLPLPKHGLDTTSITLMRRVRKHHDNIQRLEGLNKNLISRISVRNPEALEVICDNLLPQYIRSFENEEERHDVLLQLLEVGVNGK